MRVNWLKCFFQVIRKESLVFSKMFRNGIIDVFIMVATNVLVFTYIMPSFGGMKDYGLFIFVGLIPVVALFEIVPKAEEMVADMTGVKKISYMLTLPMPYWATFISIAIGWSISTFIITVLMFPMGKLFLLSRFSLMDISYWRLLIFLVTTNLFLGFFALWLTGLIKDMKYASWVWTRVVNPMFMFGGYFYSWKFLYNTCPLAAYLNLLNPLLYAVEGMRGAVIKEASIPFVYCVIALWAFIILFAFHGISMLKKRLDCV